MGDSGTPSASTKPDTYPPLPRVPDLTKPPAVCVAWVIAADHEDVIDALLSFGVLYWPAVGALTTGEWPNNPVCPDDCPCNWPEKPCSCEYALHQTVWYPTHRIDVPGVGMRGAAYTIRIDPDCPHHGDDLLYPDGGVWGFTLADTVLDEDERRGH